MSEDRVSVVADAIRRAAGNGVDGTEIAEYFLADALVQPYLTDEYKEATDAAMNHGQGYQEGQRDAHFEEAEVAFIAATRRLNRLRRERGLEDLSVKDLPSLDHGGEGGEKGQTKSQTDGNPATHGKPPVGVDARETTPLRYVTIELTDGSLAVSLEDADRVRAEYQRFYDFVADHNTSLVDAWHFTENVRVQKIARGEKP